ncbi:hypothetical protein NMA510612_0025 [Neisseria meningitidis]|uniref:Uncharacterized protein n=1 Tax=Neisseria meningitidis TaxID=487 RepID=X5F390_NEIME|nr:hypothetical protein NMA510612_0025 [Neisseria meningitidis]
MQGRRFVNIFCAASSNRRLEKYCPAAALFQTTLNRFY